MVSKYIEVVVPRAIDKVFHYVLPDGLKKKAEIGKRVLVPFSNRQLIGYITGFSDRPGVEKPKELIEILDDSPILDSELLELAKHLSELYLFPIGMVIKSILPTSLSSKKTLPALLVTAEDITESKVQELSTSQLPKFRSSEVQSTDTNLQYKGVLDEIIKRADSLTFSPFLLQADWENRWEIYLHVAEEMMKKNKKSILLVPEITLIPALIDKIKKRFSGRLALFHSGLTNKDKLIEWERMRKSKVDVVLGVRSAIFSPLKGLGLIVIDEEQDRSYKQEEGLRYNTREVAEIRARNNRALLIMGSLIPSVESFYGAENGRYKHLYLPKGNSAIPKDVELHLRPNIEIIDLRVSKNVDSQQSTVHSPQDLSRLNLHSLKTAGYRPLTKNRSPILTERLLIALGERIKRGERVLIFINRLGYSTSLLCSDCGFTLKCPNCDIPLPYYCSPANGERILYCYYCGHQEVPPILCPSCRGTRLYFAGTGIQKVEEEIKRSFPDARVLRIDRDTIRNKASYIEANQKIKEAEVIIGTQMVFRFKPLPPINMIGIISDSSLYLHIPDFRGSERTFQLLMQLSGLIEKNGEVLLQTFNPEHYALQYAQRYDYNGFYQREIGYRSGLNYPPFSHLIYVTLTGKQDERIKEASQGLVDILKKLLTVNSQQSTVHSPQTSVIEVLGPTRSPVSRIKGRYRWQVVIKESAVDSRQSTDRTYLREALRQWQKEPSSKGIEVEIDVNP